jgi:hypothetical protein
VTVAVGGGATTTYVAPGHVGVVVRRAGGGVDPVPLPPGLYVRNPLLTGIERYPVYMQTVAFARGAREGATANAEVRVNSREGQPLSLDVTLSFELAPAQVPALYQTFRTDIAAIQRGYVQQAVRRALQEVVGGEAVVDVMGPKKAELVARTEGLLRARLAPFGFVVRQLALGELRAPAGVVDAIGAKTSARQQALTAEVELAKRRFEATGDSIRASGRASAILVEANAQSRANALLSGSITATLVQYESVRRWDGRVSPIAGEVIPVIPLAPRPP